MFSVWGEKDWDHFLQIHFALVTQNVFQFLKAFRDLYSKYQFYLSEKTLFIHEELSLGL